LDVHVTVLFDGKFGRIKLTNIRPSIWL